MDSFFNNDEYLNFLLELCNDDKGHNQGRVSGGQLIIDYLKRLDIQPSETVLEIGCGTGRVMHLLEEEFGAKVYGCDVSAPALEHLRKHRPEFKDKAWLLDSYGLSLYAPNSFDYAVYWGVFELTPQTTHLMHLSGLLKTGGKALLGSIKHHSPLEDDEMAQGALAAYERKSYPINVNRIDLFEEQVDYLGFRIAERLVFENRKDILESNFTVDQGGRGVFGEAVYLIEKVRDTPLSKASNIFFGPKPESPECKE